MINLSAISDILKKVIAPTIQNVLFKETILLDQIKKNSGVTPMGKDFYVSIRIGQHSGIYQIAENGTVRKGQAKYDQAKIACKYAFGSFELTDQAIEASNNNTKALANILTENSIGLKEDLAKDLNRVFHGYGNGQLCLVNATTGLQTTIAVDTPGTDYLAEGMVIDINGEEVTIVTVDSDTQITITPAATVADNEVITKADDAEMMGLVGIIDDQSYVDSFEDITRSAVPAWNAYCDDTVEVLTESALTMALFKSQKYGKPKFALTGLTLFNKYGNLLTSMKRTADLKEVLSGGWKGLEIQPGIGLLLDHDTWGGFIHIIDPKSLTIGQMTDVSWLDRGAGILQKVTGKANWEGTLRFYGNLACKNVRANARLSGKTA